jgi:1-acyl-sn-glycerol-3-phosphate acyltransferase
MCNHSNQYDPEVMFTFSMLARQDFHFLCAREVFEWVFGAVGWWFQSLGCFSVLRGAADIESFKETWAIWRRAPADSLCSAPVVCGVSVSPA